MPCGLAHQARQKQPSLATEAGPPLEEHLFGFVVMRSHVGRKRLHAWSRLEAPEVGTGVGVEASLDVHSPPQLPASERPLAVSVVPADKPRVRPS